MTELAIIQAVQTAALITVAGIMIYSLYLARIQFKEAVTGLRSLMREREEMEKRIERLWIRIDAIEERLAAMEKKPDP